MSVKKCRFNILLLGILWSTFCPLWAAQVEPQTKRWDLMMIDEAPIWWNLVKYSLNADQKSVWPQRKSALNKILNEYPTSQWADDAALILAYNKLAMEGDANEAIKDLRAVIEKYPQANTIVSTDGAIFDDVWLKSQGVLVYFNPDDSIQLSMPFGKNPVLSQQNKEILAYFDHLEKYPVYTKDVARIYISNIYGSQKNYKEAAQELEIFFTNTLQMMKALQADRIAVKDANGFLIRELSRPQYTACFSLISCYEDNLINIEKAIETADRLAPILNQGANYKIMKRIGEFYEKHGLTSKAKLQYLTALVRINEYIAADRERSKRLKYIKVPAGDEERSPQLTQAAAELKKMIK
jgi:tetratricopeptide (TPR) repeat protein